MGNHRKVGCKVNSVVFVSFALFVVLFELILIIKPLVLLVFDVCLVNGELGISMGEFNGGIGVMDATEQIDMVPEEG